MQQRLAKNTHSGSKSNEIEVVKKTTARDFGIGFINNNDVNEDKMNSVFETKSV